MTGCDIFVAPGDLHLTAVKWTHFMVRWVGRADPPISENRHFALGGRGQRRRSLEKSSTCTTRTPCALVVSNLHISILRLQEY